MTARAMTTGAALEGFAIAHPELSVTIVTHARPGGQSAADPRRGARRPRAAHLHARRRRAEPARGHSNGPAGAAARRERAAASRRSSPGQRAKRRNDTLSKRVASRAANGFRGWLLRDGTRDTGCGLKAFRRDAFLDLPYFDHMHRFLPALFQRDGWEVAHVDVGHRPRVAGRSKYTNFGRAIVGASDLLGVAWLIRRRRRLGPGETTISANAGAERHP
jgi:dolichol-phosphate mannosyltransferase